MFSKAFMFRLAHKMGLSRQMIGFMNRDITVTHQGRQRPLPHYQPTGHDVIVSTYLRSGTYWTLQITYQIAHLGDGTFRQIHDVVPWAESSVSNIVSLSDTSPLKRSPTGLRVIKTHLESAYVPYCEHAKYITVVRDPKDVFVSFYFFRGSSFTLDEWLDMYLSGCLTMASMAGAYCRLLDLA